MCMGYAKDIAAWACQGELNRREAALLGVRPGLRKGLIPPNRGRKQGQRVTVRARHRRFVTWHRPAQSPCQTGRLPWGGRGAAHCGLRTQVPGGLGKLARSESAFKPRIIFMGINVPDFLNHPTRHLFFTGKGGVGKTSLSTATAIALADSGLRVLLVSTDAASNLDEMLGAPLRNTPTPVPGVPGLSMLNIDPDVAAEAYRQRVIAQMAGSSTEDERATVREQLSGACTTEIASFDEFSNLLAGGAGDYDHIVFDTAPTGHTLRLLSLPKAWSGFLKGNDRGASCLGPHSGLKMQETRFNAALAALSDSTQTTIVLVARPDQGALAEAARTSAELRTLGLGNQHLAINGVFQACNPHDDVARALEALGAQAMSSMPEALRALPQHRVPLRPFDTVGLPALRALLSDQPTPADLPAPQVDAPLSAERLDKLIDELAATGKGLVMVMGKGGVGKTTIAAALAIGLVRRGLAVHLSTTDPAAHLAMTLDGQLPPERRPHRPQGRDPALHRQDHGGQGQPAR